MLPRPATYTQLQPEDRVTLASLKQPGLGIRAMARVLGRNASTISRELQRNTAPTGRYGSALAQQNCSHRRAQARLLRKLHVDSILFSAVAHFLRLRWSPEQVALALARLYPKGHEYHVSHETIYNCIYAQPVGELRRELIACLRHAHNKRLPRSKGEDRRGQFPDMQNIHVRKRPADTPLTQRVSVSGWQRLLPVRQQFGDEASFMRRQALQHILQVRMRVEPIELG